MSFDLLLVLFWIWAPLGMAPEIEERARVPCHGQRIPLRIPKRISWTSRAALGPFHPRRIAPGAYPERFQKHSPGCKVAWFKHTAPGSLEASRHPVASSGCLSSVSAYTSHYNNAKQLVNILAHIRENSDFLLAGAERIPRRIQVVSVG